MIELRLIEKVTESEPLIGEEPTPPVRRLFIATIDQAWEVTNSNGDLLADVRLLVQGTMSPPVSVEEADGGQVIAVVRLGLNPTEVSERVAEYLGALAPANEAPPT